MQARTLLAAVGLSFSAFAQDSLAPKVRISADFPGGNVLVISNAADGVVLAPDLRGGRPWFYWCFEAAPLQPGPVTFRFTEAMRIGVRGPAISRDGGASWNWLGMETVQLVQPSETPSGTLPGDAFTYTFSAAGQAVRFAVGIPYLDADLQAFLKTHASNPHLSRSVLTQTRQGRPAPLLQIGTPGAGRRPMLVTARHHACEAMASYVLEGFLAEALSDSSGAQIFRQRHVLYAVPMMDGDGVEAGDQGKGRHPHDHNRDYGRTNIYPEVKAVQALARSSKITFALDFHCPALRGDVHETFYFDGIRVPHIESNVEALRAWLAEELPPGFGAGPANFMKRPPAVRPENGMPCSIYFAGQPGVIFAATLECPYTQPSRPLDAAMARAYGRGLLNAWSRMTFRAADGTVVGDGLQAAALPDLRADFQKRFRSQPREVEQQLAGLRADPATPALLRIEAELLTAALQVRRQQYMEADTLLGAVVNDARATARQHASAAVQRVLAAFADTDTEAAAARRQEALAAFEQVPYAAPAQQAEVYGAVSAWHQRQGDLPRALDFAGRQLAVVPGHERAQVLNRMAAMHEASGNRTRAIEIRQETVRFLRAQPFQRSVFGAIMAGELCLALDGIPTATAGEKQAAWEAFTSHPVSPDWLKDRIREALKPERLPR